MDKSGQADGVHLQPGFQSYLVFLKWYESEEICDEPAVEDYQVAWLNVIANRNFATT
jgi:hypothetical protein